MNVSGHCRGNLGIRDLMIDRLVTRMGGTVTKATIPANTDIYVSWRFKQSPKNEQRMKDGMLLVCIDLGYFDRDKFERFSLSLNGVHGDSVKVESVRDLPARPHPELQPWRDTGEIIQIISAGYLKPGQVRAEASDLPDKWLENTLRDVREVWPNHRMEYRLHPRTMPPGEPKPVPLEETFAETFVSITYGSNTAVQTIIAGVPTIVHTSRCVAYPVATDQYEIFRSENREAWIHDLSYREYHMMDEDELDRAIEYIMRGYEQIHGAL